MPDDVTITICALDRGDFARALAVVAERREKAAHALRPGIKRDNMMARAIRLKRMAEELGAS
jgi:hypothetical protein